MKDCLFRRIVDELRTDDHDAYAPPIFVSLIGLVVMFFPWRWVMRVGIFVVIWSLFGVCVVQ
jgi:hypothetical protein